MRYSFYFSECRTILWDGALPFYMISSAVLTYSKVHQCCSKALTGGGKGERNTSAEKGRQEFSGASHKPSGNQHLECYCCRLRGWS